MLFAEALWFRSVTGADLLAMEGQSLYSTGGGSGWIDVPDSQKLLDFMHVPTGSRPDLHLDAHVIGNIERHAEIRMESRSDQRYRILNQGRFRQGSQRHPAWDPTLDPDFPTAPSITTATDAKSVLDAIGGLRLYLVRASDGRLYAGYTTGTARPSGWPAELAPLFSSTAVGMLTFPVPPPAGSQPLSALAHKVLDAWRRKQNVLLYGPPGSGKTHAMAELWALLASSGAAPGADASPGGQQVLAFDPTNKHNPWPASTATLPFPTPVAQDWVTFHQNYSYEEFILGLRPQPDPATGVLTLKPRLGRLLNLALRIWDPPRVQSAVMFIDEVNRGNVSRIFGEFITFMDPDYRHTDATGALNVNRLPIPLTQVSASDGSTEPIDKPRGGTVSLPDEFYFPRHVYVVASMNSVDRAVAPLDTALGRRFERIEARSDPGALAAHLGIDTPTILRDVAAFGAARAASPGALPPMPTLSASETAWLLLRRLNDYIATSLGVDFEIGHTYFLGVTDWPELAEVWDHAIWPQLQDRYSSRPQHLSDLLKIADADVPPSYLFRRRELLPSMAPVEREAFDVPSLSDASAANPADVQTTLIFLALP